MEDDKRISRNQKAKLDFRSNTGTSEDLFYNPVNVVYIPKKISAYKSFKGKYSRQGLKKMKIEKLINYIKDLCYHKYYPILSYKLKFLQQLSLERDKLISLYNVIKLSENKWLKVYDSISL